ncbi:uncharacterized protein G2W53_039107 [Senna tora]|uniref:Uncharacterized protein n=1 Tax=Senna tora TaxID=362788 RepID=A0A834W5U1_9FABA|nr:uncharacterized protein G2W53_039107 [Senna tora]
MYRNRLRKLPNTTSNRLRLTSEQLQHAEMDGNWKDCEELELLQFYRFLVCDLLDFDFDFDSKGSVYQYNHFPEIE